MAKWADYLISAVKYEETEKTKHISKLKVHTDNGDSMGTEEIWIRTQVIDNIDAKKTFKTIYKGANEKWRMGEDVRKITIAGKHYIRTDANETEKDNLGDLPEF